MDGKMLHDIFNRCKGVTTDTRTLSGGEMFFALKGENFDGNEYALKALEAGAACAVVDGKSAAAGLGNPKIIPVDDTLKTLQDLAAVHRMMPAAGGKPAVVIGLTGTNGKTTTKELIKAVLSARYNVTATEGNLNNSIGVPLTLLKINADTQLAVVEMGASHPGDIRELVNVAMPDYGLITNVGKAHLLGFGSFDGVKKTKGELYDHLAAFSGKAFVNMDSADLRGMASERKGMALIPYGVGYEGAEVLASSQEHPFLRISVRDGNRPRVLCTRMVGAYNADNVMAALAVGKEFGIPLQQAAAAIENYVPSNNRSQMQKVKSNVLIIDAYNANPTSMEAALDNFSSILASHRAVMLGDMLELGADSRAEHSAVLRKVLRIAPEKIFLVGAEFGAALRDLKDEAAGADIIAFPSSDGLAEWLKEHPLENFTILIKGSRGTRMEKAAAAMSI